MVTGHRQTKGHFKVAFALWGGGVAGEVAEARARGGSATPCLPCRTAYVNVEPQG